MSGPNSRAVRATYSRQMMYAVALIVSLFVVFFLFNLDRWFFLQNVFQTFDEKLEQRLYSIGVLSSEIIEGIGVDHLNQMDANPLKKLLLESQLREIKAKNFLEAAYIVDQNLRVILESQFGGRNPIQRTYIRADSLSLKRAFQGHLTASPLHEIAGQYFKNGYAPLRDSHGRVVGLLVVEASDRYFATIRNYKKAFWATLLASLLLFILFSTFVWGAFKKVLRAEASLRESERLAFMGKMAAVLAHEIRNPLGIIRGTADVLKSKYGQKEEGALFDYIPSEVNRLNLLINNFLTFSRVQKLSLERVSLPNLIEQIVKQLRLDDQTKQIALETQIESENLEIKGDENLLKQVFLNIIRNAVQASQAGGTVKITQKQAERKRRSGVLLSVQDFGEGIEGDVDRIFEPFYTTKSSGTGLGMAISKKIIEAHGGHISVESEPSKGTTVFIWLPREQNRGN